MTSERIAARNRANAQKSTGPKTAAGKAIVSGNARRHGATSRPDPESVATWLAIILDDPDILAGAPIPSDDRGFRALALAEAEARQVAAERALLEFERGEAEPSESLQDLRQYAELIREDIDEGGLPERKVRSGYGLLMRIAQWDLHETQPGGRHHRRLQRYLREARSRKRRALQAWIEVSVAGAERRLVDA